MKKIGFLFMMFVALFVNLSSVSGQANDSLDLSMQQPKLTAIPDYVFNKTDLRKLDVSFNHISAISPKIVNLTKLEVLNLSGNEYLRELPDFLLNMESLKTIYFEGMKTWSQAKQDAAVQRFAQKGINIILNEQFSGVTDQE